MLDGLKALLTGFPPLRIGYLSRPPSQFRPKTHLKWLLKWHLILKRMEVVCNHMKQCDFLKPAKAYLGGSAGLFILRIRKMDANFQHLQTPACFFF